MDYTQMPNPSPRNHIRLFSLFASLSMIALLSSCFASGVGSVCFSPDSTMIAHSKSTVFVPFWPLPLFDANHNVYWKPVGSSTAPSGRLHIGKTSNLFYTLGVKPIEQECEGLCFSPDSRHLAAERSDSTLLIINVESGKSWILSGFEFAIGGFVWSAADEVICWSYYSPLEDGPPGESLQVWKHNIHESSPSEVSVTKGSMRDLVRVNDAQGEWFTGLVKKDDEEPVISPDGRFAAKRKPHFPCGIHQTLSVYPIAED